jgi:endonuclease/exonuclease/phosphatase family metal-dependent hydrolase
MPNSIHLAAWNLNHRTGRKSIPPAVLHAISHLDIDVLVLTEFVDGDHQRAFKESLQDIGFASLAVSLKAPRQNQVLIAARSPLADDDGLPVPGYTEAAATNWLHRRLPALGLEVVGLRAPVYLDADHRLGYWQQVESILQNARARPLIVIGDFGCDPHTDTRPSAHAFQRLRQQHGFQLPNPTGDWSYRNPEGNLTTRIDHALASPGLRLTTTRYLYKASRHTLAGTASAHGAPLSDHALLSITLERPARRDRPTRLNQPVPTTCTTSSAML